MPKSQKPATEINEYIIPDYILPDVSDYIVPDISDFVLPETILHPISETTE